jgi:hypothetical protein
MKKISTFICAGVLMSALCAAVTACNEPNDQNRIGLGEDIPGIETKQATGTVIGSYSNGFCSLLVQVDEEFPIGKTIEYNLPAGYRGPAWHPQLPEAGTYLNMIQVQAHLGLEITSNRISFSYRAFIKGKDDDLFTVGNGMSRWDTAAPDVPICVITDIKPLND